MQVPVGSTFETRYVISGFHSSAATLQSRAEVAQLAGVPENQVRLPFVHVPESKVGHPGEAALCVYQSPLVPDAATGLASPGTPTCDALWGPSSSSAQKSCLQR
eukprot:1145572-Pelagomonas_calceolata.AAC.4